MTVRHHLAVLVIATATLSTLAGCATGGPVRVASCVSPVGAQSIADSLVRDGCYNCLLKARDAYARLFGDCNSSDLLVRWFETQLLVILRERELAIDDGAST